MFRVGDERNLAHGHLGWGTSSGVQIRTEADTRMSLNRSSSAIGLPPADGLVGRIHRPRIDPVRAERHRCNVGAAMKKLRQFSLSDEAEMRAFYASCSISESTTEAATYNG